MIATIISGILLLAAVLMMLSQRRTRREVKRLEALAANAEFAHERDSYQDKADEAHTSSVVVIGAAVVTALVAGIILFFASYDTVDAKTQGVITTHGRMHDETAGPGWVWKKPWDKVTEISTATEGKRYHGDSAIEVRLKDGNKAYVSAAVRSGVAPEKANKVFESFRNYDDPTVEFRSQIVSDQLKAAMYRVFSEVDPLSLSGQAEKPLNLTAIEKQITEDLLERGEGMINANEFQVTITLVTPDKKAQSVIDKYTDEVNKTRIAVQAQKTADEQALANKKLAASLSKDPNVLVSRCLDLIESGDLKLPAGGSCWPGGGTGVVLPSAK